VQAAAGFLAQLDRLPDLTASPFNFGPRYQAASRLIHREVRTFATTSMGRLFDAAAALLGFVRETTYEGQAAVWVEQLARQANNPNDVEAYPFPFIGRELDFRPLLASVIQDRTGNRATAEISRAFQRGIAQGLFAAVRSISREHGLPTVVLSGGVFQNELLLADLKPLFENESLQVWTNHAVPPNDGGISLGQAVIAAFEMDAAKGASYA
jgi:hydrogenase maturation protein HypF